MCIALNLKRKCEVEQRLVVALYYAPAEFVTAWPTITSDPTTGVHNTGTTGFTMDTGKKFAAIELEDGVQLTTVLNPENGRYKTKVAGMAAVVDDTTLALCSKLAKGTSYIFLARFDDGKLYLISSQYKQQRFQKLDPNFQTGMLDIEIKETEFVLLPVEYTATTPLVLL